MMDSILNLIAPHHCYGCGKIGTTLCHNCKYDIIYEGFSGCIACGRTSLVGICPACATSYDKAWCAGSRTDMLERLIDAYKFERVRAAAAPLGALLQGAVPVLPPETVVVPVPTVSGHIRVRGYDHALLLAREFAAAQHLTVRQLVCRRNDTSQRGLNKRQRFAAAKAAFYCRETLPAVPYLVVDDITTTNATLRYVAQTLRDGGAQTVWVAVVARQPLDKQG